MPTNIKKLAKQLISYAESKGTYLVIRFQDYKNKVVNVKNGKVDSFTLTEIKGTGIHAFTKSGHSGFASVDTLTSKKRLFECLNAAIKSADTASAKKFETTKELFKLKPLKKKVFQAVPIDAFQIKKEILQWDLLTFNKEIMSNNSSFSISNTAVFSCDHWRILRSDGTDVEFSISNSNLYTIISSLKKDDANQFCKSTHAFGYEVLGEKKHLEKHKQLLHNGLKYFKDSKNAKQLGGGNYALLLDSSVAGVFMHEAFGHTAESDHVYHKSPLLKNGKIRQGDKIAASFINIFDFATKKQRGFCPFSSFGVQRKKSLIVKQGKINNLISDVLTANKAGCKLTGCARCEHYFHTPVPRMSSTEVRLDKKHTIPVPYDHRTASIEKIQQTLKKHKVFEQYPKIIYLMGSSGGQVDSNAGNFQFSSVVSFELQKNSSTLLKPVSFSGITLEALKSIKLAFGKTMDWPGFCSRSGQKIPVNARAPMLLLAPNKYITVG